MRRAILITTALVMTAGATVAEAGPRRGDGRDGYHGPRGPYVVTHRPAFRRGQVLAPAYRGPRYVIADYRRYRLRPPPVGYRYYRYGNDILLTAVATGAIASVFGGLFAAPPPPPMYGPPPPPAAYYGAPPPEPAYDPEPDYAPEPYDDEPAPMQDYGPPDYIPQQDRG